MVHKALSECVIVTAGAGEKDWNNVKVKEWILNASGKFERSVTDETTHFVVTKKLWTTGGPVVQDVITRKKNGQSIKVVSQDWLEDSLQAKSKKKEKEYQFSIPGLTGKEFANGNPRSHTGLLKELYLENTELTPAQEKRNLKKQQMDEDIAKELAAERDREFQAHISASMSIPEQAAIFKRGAQKAKTAVGSNHHVYQDPTGFHFDVILTKVDVKNNTNERYNLVLKIWESNATPHTYAFTATFDGTKVVQKKVNTIIAIGANLPTALRGFRNTFLEKTGIDWNDRVKVSDERARREHNVKRMKQAGLPIEPHVAEDIRTQKFSYYPPTYGPVGELSTPPQQQEEETIPIDLDNEAPQQPRFVSRSQTPVRADFDARDLARFNEAQLEEVEGREKLDPMAPPYDFGKTMSSEELTAPDPVAGESTAPTTEGMVDAATRYGGATEYMDLSSYTPAVPVGQQAYASPPPEPEPENSEEPIENGDSVLGKRKDSPVVERPQEEIKKQKFDLETGEYIIEEAVEEDDA